MEFRPRARLYKVLYCLLRIYLSYKRLNLIKPLLEENRYLDQQRSLNEKNALLLYNTILDLKGLFIKVGQFMSLRVDLLPKVYIKTLSKLQDQVPPAEFHFIRSRIVEEMGKPPEEIFKYFSPEPIAAASLGQVHDAKLQDGTRVAVKVQYPNIENLVEVDLKILGLILRWIERFRKNLDTKFLLDEFKKLVSLELDYINEGKNCERIDRIFRERPEIIVPKVIWKLTTRRVLVLEFVEGIKITDVEKIQSAGIDIKKVSELVMDCYFYQLFKAGFFQADPHPGNLFVRPGPKLVMVDFGLAKELPKGLLGGFGKLAFGLIQRDPKIMSEGFHKMGFLTVDGSPKAFEEFSEFVIKYSKEFIYRNPKKVDYQGIMQEIVEVVRKHPLVRIPTDFILIGRVLGLLSGLGRQLGAKIQVDEIVQPYLFGAGASK